MTEIPQKQEGQTWANYFIERLIERDADAYVELPDESEHKKSRNLVVQVGMQDKPEVEIELHYVWQQKRLRFPDNKLNFAQILTSSYERSGRLTIEDSEGECEIVFYDDGSTAHHNHILRATGALENILSKERQAHMTTEQTVCALADFVKQRQDFYKSEEQK